MTIWRHASCNAYRIMDIRIDFISNQSNTVVRIAGRLAGNAVAELERACDSIEKPYVVDLSSLLFADEKGINAIRKIADKGAQVHGASPFVQILLDKRPGWKTDGGESKPV